MNQYIKKSLNSEDDAEDDDKLQTLFGTKPKPYQHYEHTFTTNHVHFYLSKPIVQASEYTDMIHRISSASANDIVYIHLNTTGGDLATGVQIINAMQNSEAKIVTVLEGLVYSLGTLIFFAGDELVVNDHCMIMFHNFRGGLIGPGHELTAQLESTVRWFATLARKIYIPFLTEDEIVRITKGEDLWMGSEDIRVRLDNIDTVRDITPEPPAKTKLAKAPKPPKKPID